MVSEPRCKQDGSRGLRLGLAAWRLGSAAWRLGLLGVSFALLGAARPPTVQEHGRQLFQGEANLVGRMVGHTHALPPQAVRCMNCHQTQDPPSTASSSSSAQIPSSSAAFNTQDFGPKLNPDTLTQTLPRRGGPASSYDLKAFCRLLREGIDPAHVMIPQTMPRYVLTDAECEALWTFLITR